MICASDGTSRSIGVRRWTRLSIRPKTESDSGIETALGLDHKGRRKKRRRGWLYALAALLVIVAAPARLFSGMPVTPPRSTTPRRRPQIGDLTVAVSATGTLQPLTQVDISSELSGVVRSVSVDENQQVKKGDVLAELDTAQARGPDRARRGFRQGGRRQGRQTPRTTLKESEQALVRAEQLVKRGMATDQALEAATATRDRADAALDSRRGQSRPSPRPTSSAADRPREEHDLCADRRHRADALGRSRPDGRLVAAGAGAVRHRRRPEEHGAEGGDRRGRHRRRQARPAGALHRRRLSRPHASTPRSATSPMPRSPPKASSPTMPGSTSTTPSCCCGPA